MSLYSVVVPVFNSEHTLRELYQRIRAVFEDTIHEEFELILVDDSSRDQSYRIMKELRSEDPRVRIVQMAKNFGQHPALRCGFSYESPEERVYLLLLLQGALSQGEERRALSGRADRLGRALDHGWPVSVDLENETGAAAALLARKLLLLKFVQGFPLVGAVGGAANLSLAGRVSRWGALKYKKRFLEKKVRGL